MKLEITLSFSMTGSSDWFTFCPTLSWPFSNHSQGQLRSCFCPADRCDPDCVFLPDCPPPKGLDFLFVLSDLFSLLPGLDFKLFLFGILFSYCVCNILLNRSSFNLPVSYLRYLFISYWQSGPLWLFPSDSDSDIIVWFLSLTCKQISLQPICVVKHNASWYMDKQRSFDNTKMFFYVATHERSFLNLQKIKYFHQKHAFDYISLNKSVFIYICINIAHLQDVFVNLCKLGVAEQ